MLFKQPDFKHTVQKCWSF